MSFLSNWIGAIAAGSVVAILVAIGAAVVWYRDEIFTAGKKDVKLHEAEKELEDEKRTSQILSESRTPDDTSKRLNDGTF
jgi:hypothetical protein